jgi:hypothetical protein
MSTNVTGLDALPFLVQLDSSVYVRVSQELGFDDPQRLHRVFLGSLRESGGAYMLDIDVAVALAWGEPLNPVVPRHKRHSIADAMKYF